MSADTQSADCICKMRSRERKLAQYVITEHSVAYEELDAERTNGRSIAFSVIWLYL